MLRRRQLLPLPRLLNFLLRIPALLDASDGCMAREAAGLAEKGVCWAQVVTRDGSLRIFGVLEDSVGLDTVANVDATSVCMAIGWRPWS